VGLDQRLVDPAGDERLQGRPGRGRAEGIEPPVVQVGNARREAEPQEMAQGEDVVGNAAAVGVVDGDLDVGAVIEQAVDDMGRFAFGRGNLSATVGSIAGGKVCVEGDGRGRRPCGD